MGRAPAAAEELGASAPREGRWLCGRRAAATCGATKAVAAGATPTGALGCEDMTSKKALLEPQRCNKTSIIFVIRSPQVA